MNEDGGCDVVRQSVRVAAVVALLLTACDDFHQKTARVMNPCNKPMRAEFFNYPDPAKQRAASSIVLPGVKRSTIPYAVSGDGPYSIVLDGKRHLVIPKSAVHGSFVDVTIPPRECG